MRKVNALGGRFLRKGTVGERVREIAILRSSYRSGSIYALGQHTLIGRDCGLTDDETVPLATEAADSTASDAERRVLASSDELSAQQEVSEQPCEALRAHREDTPPVEQMLPPGFPTLR